MQEGPALTHLPLVRPTGRSQMLLAIDFSLGLLLRILALAVQTGEETEGIARWAPTKEHRTLLGHRPTKLQLVCLLAEVREAAVRFRDCEVRTKSRPQSHHSAAAQNLGGKLGLCTAMRLCQTLLAPR